MTSPAQLLVPTLKWNEMKHTGGVQSEQTDLITCVRSNRAASLRSGGSFLIIQRVFKAMMLYSLCFKPYDVSSWSSMEAADEENFKNFPLMCVSSVSNSRSWRWYPSEGSAAVLNVLCPGLFFFFVQKKKKRSKVNKSWDICQLFWI